MNWVLRTRTDLDEVEVSVIVGQYQEHGVGEAKRVLGVMVGVVPVAAEDGEREVGEALALELLVGEGLHEHVTHQPRHVLLATLADVVVVTTFIYI